MSNEVHISTRHLNNFSMDAVDSHLQSLNKGCLSSEKLCFSTVRNDDLDTGIFK